MGLTKIEETKTEIFPNPAKSHITIKSNKEIDSVSMYTITGSEIFSNKIFSNDKLNVSNMNPGTYLLLIYYKDKTKESKKIIVSR